MEIKTSDGTTERLPGTLPEGKVVLVLGPEKHAGRNELQRFIKELDPRSSWTRPVFKDDVGGEAVNANVGMVLTMTNMRRGALTSVRIEAKKRGVFYLPRPLIPSEVRSALLQVASQREEKSKVTKIAEHRTVVAVPTPTTTINEEHVEPVVVEASVPEAPSSPQSSKENELDQAFRDIDAFGEAFDRVQSAILVVSGESKALAEERDALKAKVVAMEIQITELIGRLGSAHDLSRENTKLKETNRALNEQVTELQGSLERLRGLINNALGK